MTERWHRVRVLLVVLVVVGSVIAVGGGGFIGGVSAEVNDISEYSSNTDTEVEIGQSTVRQNVSFNVSIDGNSGDENVTLNASSAVTNGSSVTLPDGGVSLNETSGITVDSVQPNGDDFNINLSVSSGGDRTITANLSHDTSGISTESFGGTYNISQIDNTTEITPSYDLSDTTAPTFERASRINNTAINATFTDSGTGLKASGISSNNFTLTDGAIDSVSTNFSDSDNAGAGNVTIILQDPVDANSVDVDLDNDGIRDLASTSNSIDSGTQTVTGMDGVAPVTSFTNPSEGDRVQSQDFINGTATDGGTNIKEVNLTVQRDSDNNYWNDTSSAWESSSTNLSATAVGTFNSGDEDWYFDSSAITADDSYTVRANATDTAGNLNSSWATVNYTLYTPSSTSSSSSSSSGPNTQYAGSSSSQTKTIQTNSDTSTVSFSEGSGVASVTFGAQVSGSVKTQEFSSEPSGVSSAPGRSVSISEIAVPEGARDTSATIRMRVSTDRLTEVEADASNLQVTRYNDNEWETLPTEITTQTSEQVVLEAETPGFSLFAVSAIEDTSTDDGGDGTDSEQENETDVETTEPAETTEESTDGIPGFGVVVSLVALIAVALLARRTRA